jgi:RNA-binding protein 23/39
MVPGEPFYARYDQQHQQQPYYPPPMHHMQQPPMPFYGHPMPPMAMQHQRFGPPMPPPPPQQQRQVRGAVPPRHFSFSAPWRGSGPADRESMARTVFVQGVPLGLDEHATHRWFAEHAGTVRGVKLVRNRHTNEPLGFCYVEFETALSVDKALTCTGSTMNDGDDEPTPLRVVSPHIEGLLPSSSSSSSSASAAAVSAASSGHASAALPAALMLAALAQRQQQQQQHGAGGGYNNDSNGDLQFAMALRKLDARTLVVSNLDALVGEDDVVAIFAPFGMLTSVTMDADSVGCARVRYESVDSAIAAQVYTNGMSLCRVPIVVAFDIGGDMSLATRASAKLNGAPKNNTPRVNDLTDNGQGLVPLTNERRADLMAKLAGASTGATAEGEPTSRNQPIIMASGCPPSPCLMLRHMFDPAKEEEEDFDADIELDVREECEQQFGKVVHIFVDKNSMGTVYLRLESVEAAERARLKLNGRLFDGNHIAADFLPLALYEFHFNEHKK